MANHLQKARPLIEELEDLSYFSLQDLKAMLMAPDKNSVKEIEIALLIKIGRHFSQFYPHLKDTGNE